MDKQTIHFSQGRQAQVVIPPAGTRVDDIVRTLDIPPPEAVMLIAGGADNMAKSAHASLQRLFSDGLAHAAAIADALIIDGGTHSGVMALMGQGVAEQARKPALLGVSPEGIVTYPGKTAREPEKETAPLDPDHAYFVLVATDEWGGETDVMYELAQSFSAGCPSVAVLVNGGGIARNEVLYNVRQKRPVIIIEGSGRLADEIASIRRGQPAPAGADPDIAEIVTRGDLHLFPINGSAQELEQLVLDLFSQQK